MSATWPLWAQLVISTSERPENAIGGVPARRNLVAPVCCQDLSR
jgi:hypothetical protein